MLPDGTTRELSSANNGAVAALLQSVKPASWWEEIIEMARAGGGSSRPGAVRSITAKPPVFAVDGITASRFKLCVEAGMPPAVTRDQTTGVHAVTIVAETGNKQVKAEFAAGQATRRSRKRFGGSWRG